MKNWLYRFVRRHPWWTGIIGGLALSPVILWWSKIVDWTDDHEGLAAWAQAVGVVAAIAIPLMWATGAKSREARAVEQRLVNRASALVLQIRQYLNSMAKWSVEGQLGEITASDYTPNQAAVLAAQLQQFPVLDLPDYSMTAALIALMGKMNRISSLLVDPPIPDDVSSRSRYVKGFR